MLPAMPAWRLGDLGESPEPLRRKRCWEIGPHELGLGMGGGVERRGVALRTGSGTRAGESEKRSRVRDGLSAAVSTAGGFP